MHYNILSVNLRVRQEGSMHRYVCKSFCVIRMGFSTLETQIKIVSNCIFETFVVVVVVSKRISAQ